MSGEYNQSRVDDTHEQARRMLAGEASEVDYSQGGTANRLVYPEFQGNAISGRVVPIGGVALASAVGFAVGGWSGLILGVGGDSCAAMLWSGGTQERESYQHDRQYSFYLRRFLPETEASLDLVQLQSELMNSPKEDTPDEVRVSIIKRLMPNFAEACPVRGSVANLMSGFDRDITNLAMGLSELRHAIQECQLTERDNEAVTVISGTLLVCSSLNRLAPLQSGEWCDYIIQKSLGAKKSEAESSTVINVD